MSDCKPIAEIKVDKRILEFGSKITDAESRRQAIEEQLQKQRTEIIQRPLKAQSPVKKPQPKPVKKANKTLDTFFAKKV